MKKVAGGSDQQSNSEQSLSQIGSLVSYSINYMEKQNKLMTQSKLGVLEEVRGSDSDNSLLVEKESQENQSSHEEDESIDTIEEEVDLSQSEGSDHEPQKAKEGSGEQQQQVKEVN